MIHIPRLPWEQFFMLHAHLAATEIRNRSGDKITRVGQKPW